MPEIQVTIVSGEDVDVIIAQDDTDIEVNIADSEQVDVNIATDGPPGAKGDKGDDGDKGDKGDDGATGGNYEHAQGVAAAIWTVNHNLGYNPNITTVDSANREVIGDVEYLTVNTIQVTFSGAFSGKAFVS